MNRIPLYLLTALAAISCVHRDRQDIAVPRPVAYHRITIPDSVYRMFNAGAVSIQINASTTDTIVTAGNSWITARYTGMDASMYITVAEISPDTADESIENRVERMSLNTGGHPTEVISFTTPAGFDARMTVTRTGSPTPVQFIATDHRTILVSGVGTVGLSVTAPADSLSPITEMLERDITHLLKTLTPR
ncbi:MAG: hypothetical protein K2L41_00225 [Muribaculaceae bacterium]|nr:hypothetical protein [Muribaculaceae bacterium]